MAWFFFFFLKEEKNGQIFFSHRFMRFKLEYLVIMQKSYAWLPQWQDNNNNTKNIKNEKMLWNLFFYYGFFFSWARKKAVLCRFVDGHLGASLQNMHNELEIGHKHTYWNLTCCSLQHLDLVRSPQCRNPLQRQNPPGWDQNTKKITTNSFSGSGFSSVNMKSNSYFTT